MFDLKKLLKSTILCGFLCQSALVSATCLNLDDTPTLCETSEILFASGEAAQLQEKAQALNNAVAIYEYLRNNTEYSVYHGSRSSSLNTFLGLAGNDVDLATTLIALYRAVGIHSRYVVGEIQLTAEEIASWTNIANPTLAIAILKDQGINVIDDTDLAAIVVEHVWVEALVNFSSYRGTQSDQQTCAQVGNGCQWLALDPSFKRRQFSSDTKEGGKSYYRNLLAEVNFDYSAYYHAESNQALRDKSPLEIFEEQALAYLRENHPGVTLEDVIDSGEVIVEELGLLPSSLPYKVVGNQRKYDSIVDHDNSDDESVKWQKKVKVSLTPIANGAVCSFFSTGSSTTVAELSTKRLTVNWGVIDGRTELALRLDGENIGGSISGNLNIGCGAGSERFSLGSQFNVEVAIDGPPNIDPIVVNYNNLIAGGYYLVATGGETSNWTQVERAYQQLLQSNKEYPLLTDTQGEVYVDSDKNGVIDLYDILLLDDQGAQDALTGGLLYTAQAHYYTRLKEASKRYSRLKNIVSPIAAFVGVVSTTYEVERVDSTPFAILPGGLLIDLKGIRLNGSWEADKEETYSNSTFKFLGHTASSLEHEVWQELTGYDAVSTMRGIQFALKDNVELLNIHNTQDEDNFEQSLGAMGITNTPPAGFTSYEYDLFDKRLVNWAYSGEEPTQGMYIYRGNVEGLEPSDLEANAFLVDDTGVTIQNFGTIEQQLLDLIDQENALQVKQYDISGFTGFTVTAASISNPAGFALDEYQKISDNVWRFTISETVSHPDGVSQVTIDINLGDFTATAGVSFDSSTPTYTISCNGQSYDDIASELLISWRACFAGDHPSDFFDVNKGFDPSDVFYQKVSPNLDEHDFQLVNTIRSGMYFLPDTHWRNYTIPARLTRGPTYLFSVYIEDTLESDTNNLVSSGYIIQNHSLRLSAGGGYVPEGTGIDPANDTEAVTVTDTGEEIILNVSQVDFNNEVFTDKNLVAIANNDTVRTPSTVDPVSTVTGNMYHDETDILISGKGLHYAFTRTYNSNQTTSAGANSVNPNHLPFSQGWTHSYNMKLVSNDYGQYPNYGADLAPENANNNTSSITYIDERGGEHNYLVDDGDVNSQPTSPRADFDELRLNSPSIGLHTITYRNGVSYTFDSQIPNQSADMRIPGTQARLVKIEDAYGQQLNFSYNAQNQLIAISDNLALSGRTGLTLSYHTDGVLTGRLHTITDWSARTWTYAYNEQGQLISMTDPLSHSMAYTYVEGTHWLKDIIHPESRGGKQKTMTFSYYENGQAYDYVDQLGQRESLIYDLFRRRTRITNPRGYITEHYYDQNGALEKLVEPDNGILLFDNNADGLRYVKRNALGYSTHYSYHSDRSLEGAASDTRGQVTREQDALGYQQDYDYGIHDQIVRTKDKNGNVVEQEYFQTTDIAQGAVAGKLRLTRIVSATINGVVHNNVTISHYRYNADGTRKQQVEYIDPTNLARQRITNYTYQYNTDGSYQLTTEVGASGISTTIKQVQTFDALWRLTSSTQYRTFGSNSVPSALTTRYEYDSLGRVVRTTDPVGNIQETEYDANGQVIRETARYIRLSGNSQNITPRYAQCTQDTAYPSHDTCVLAEHTYDVADRLTKTMNILGATTEYTYDEMGNVLTTKNSLGHTLHYQYDSKGRAIQVTNENGYTLKTSYDLAGRVVKITDANNHAVRYTYDALGRRLSTTSPEGRITRFDQYDGNGNLLKASDANAVANQQPINSQNVSTSSVFDEFNRLVSSLNANNETTTYTYDLLGNQTSITDAKGQRTQFVYNDLGRLISVIDPIIETPTDNVVTMAYDELGNPISQTDRNGHTINFAYDQLNRLVRKDYLHDGTDDLLQYDHYGNLVSIQNSDVTYTYTYDVAGRMLSKTDSRQNRTLQWSYDLVGNMLSKTNYQGDIQRFTYDSTNRLVAAALSNAQGQLQIQASYQYDPAGRLLSRILSNGSASLYDYDKDGLLTRLQQIDVAGQVIHNRQYQHDRVGNISRMVNSYKTIDRQDAVETTTYTYDGSYRLLSADSSNDSHDLVYTYDAVGNRLSKTQAANTQYYDYSVGNRLQAVRDNSPTGALRYQLFYDANGSLIQKSNGNNQALLQLDYDQRRLVKTIAATDDQNTNNQTLSFSYDANAYRTGKQTNSEQTGNEEKKYYLEAEHLESTYNQDDQLVASYLRGVVVDEIISGFEKNRTTGKLENRTFYHDQVNSVSELTNHNGDIVQHLSYGPFGESLSDTGTSQNSLRYTGRELDAASGLYYYRARYYDPELGRFISEDPIGFQGGVNFYAYVGNNPLIYNDPMGEDINCGSSTCTFTDGFITTTPFPRQEGFPNTINSDSSFHHLYPGVVPVKNPTLTTEQINSALINNPTPSAVNNPATVEGASNDAAPGGVTSLLVFDNTWPVQSYILNDVDTNIPVVMNVTLSGHPLHPGVVGRYTTGTAGNYTVHNPGEGTSVLESNWNPLAEPIYNSTWNSQVNSILGSPSNNAAGGFVLYPNKINNNYQQSIYSK